MNVEFDHSFEKALRKLKDASIRPRLKRAILSVEGAKTPADVPNLRKLAGFNRYYRIRIGDYRVGIEFVAPDTVRFITVAHRKDIYSVFP